MLNIIVYLISPWETFHRRPMLETLAKNTAGQAKILCVNPVLTVPLRPSSWSDFFQKCKQTRKIEQISDNLHVYTPQLIPYSFTRFMTKHSSTRFLSRIMNKKLLKTLSFLGMTDGKRIAWVYRPFQVNQLGMADEDYVLYECYDEYQADRSTGELIPEMKKLELSMCSKADIVFLTSSALFEKKRSLHPNAYLMPNGADTLLFKRNGNNGMPVPDEMVSISRPIIAYIGGISSYVDIDVMEYVAGSRPEWSIVIIGRVDEKGVQIDRLTSQFSNVHFLGWKEYIELPGYSKCFDVVVLPFKQNEYIRCSNPLTLWEQLAAGNVIVSTYFEELGQLKDVVLTAGNRQEFLSQIERALNEDNTERIRKGISRASERNWDTITKKTLDVLLAEFA